MNNASERTTTTCFFFHYFYLPNLRLKSIVVKKSLARVEASKLILMGIIKSINILY